MSRTNIAAADICPTCKLRCIFRSMKGTRVFQTGGPEVLQYCEFEDPSVAGDQVLIQVEVAGVNYIDTYHRNGLYPVELPFTPGIEGAGTILEVGSRAGNFSPGDRVVFCLSRGSYAEKAAVEGWKTVHLPPEVDAEKAVAAMCQGMTAHYLTTDCYNVREGDSVLVHAAAGGVGHFLVQMAKKLGATVFGTVSTEEKAELARESGADHVIRYTEEDFEERIREVTEGQGVHVVYESVGKDTFVKSLNSLRPRGMCVLYGQSSGPVEPFDPQLLSQKGSLFLTRPTLFHYAADRSEFLRRATEVLNMIANGEIDVRIGGTFPLSEAAEVHRRLEARMTVGKILLTPKGTSR